LDFVQRPNDHDNKSRRMFGQQVPEDSLGYGFGFLVAHG
jgi:hypothetical protein